MLRLDHAVSHAFAWETQELHLRLGGVIVRARRGSRERFEPGQPVGLRFERYELL